MRLLHRLKSIKWLPVRLEWVGDIPLLLRSRWGQYAPVYRLAGELRRWNATRLAAQPLSLPAALTLQDIASIKSIIQRAASPSLDGVMQDQLFFLAVGAIHVQAQTGSNTAWRRFNQAIQTQLRGGGVPRAWSFGLLVGLCMLWLMVSHVQHTQLHKTTPEQDDTMLLASGGTADPVTISLLQLAYSKMRSGTCQLPQAAMLPQAQREAFLLFVTEGTVDVEHVESLRQALDYVNCLYPQELMRPQGRDRNSSSTMHGV